MESNKDPVEEEKFSFLQEKIKKEPLTRQKIIKIFLEITLCGILFGFMSCVGFYILKPWAETTFSDHQSKVTIPKDEEEIIEEEQLEENELTVEDYGDIYDSLYEVVEETKRSIVDVYGIHGNEEWIQDSYDTVNSISGAIVANTGAEILVLSNCSIMEESESIQVSFCDGKKYAASLKKCDRNLGVAIFSVQKSGVESSTLSFIQTAKLGNSNHIKEGDVLIAVGKPFSYSGGIGYGVASTEKQKIALPDGEYSLLLTDIPGNEKGSGFLVNVDGEIVGIIKPDLTNNLYVHTTNALGISDIKTIIELLSNDKSIPYVGISGIQVSKEVNEIQGIPVGIYVKSMEADSPAMMAGIQNGDVITQIEKTPISTVESYQKELLKYHTGDIVTLNGLRLGNEGYIEIQFKITIGSKE